MNNAGRITVVFAIAALAAIPVGTELGKGSTPVVGEVQTSSVVSNDTLGEYLAEINEASANVVESLEALDGITTLEWDEFVVVDTPPVVEDVLPNESHEQAETDLLYEVSVQCADEVNGRLDAAAEGEIGPDGVASPLWDDLVGQCMALMSEGASQAEAIESMSLVYGVRCTEAEGCFVVVEN